MSKTTYLKLKCHKFVTEKLKKVKKAKIVVSSIKAFSGVLFLRLNSLKIEKNGLVQIENNSRQLIKHNIPQQFEIRSIRWKRVEDIEGKGEIGGYQHFLLLSQCFLIDFYLSAIKTRDWVVKGDEYLCAQPIKVYLDYPNTNLSTVTIVVKIQRSYQGHGPLLYLNLSHTIPTFNDPKEEGFGKRCGENEKMLVTSIFSFPHSVFYSIKERNHHFSHV